MPQCRLPTECAILLRSENVALDPIILHALAVFCAQHVAPRNAAWRFDDSVMITVPDGAEAGRLERSLATWAMSKSPVWSWLPALSRPLTRTVLSTVDGIAWRDEQLEIFENARRLKPGGIGLIEASTGIGKTRVFSSLGHALCLSERVVIAVPTVLVGQQWQATWQAMSFAPLAEVWGRSRYGDDECASERQDAAIENARAAPAILCSHQLLPKLFDAVGLVGALLVDEAHLLDKAVMGVAGSFLPVTAFGPWLVRWYERNGFAAGGPGEIELGGRMLKLVVARMAGGQTPVDDDWRASIVGDETSQALVWLRHGKSAQQALGQLWPHVARAWLFSGTVGTTGADGKRSVSHMVRRLEIPEARAQDLGRVRSAWRDQGVCVWLPEHFAGDDGRLWLSAYRDRKEFWWAEVAKILALLQPSKKTLVLLNSYEDIDEIRSQLPLARLHEFVASSRETPFEASRDAFLQSGAWAWLATGSAWTGMDLPSGIARVVIGSLPLPDVEALQRVGRVEDIVFDAVSRFKQGLGRLVRGTEGGEKELLLLDGRINDKTRAWRRICQPFLQVLGEEFEDHERFGVSGPPAPDLEISRK